MLTLTLSVLTAIMQIPYGFLIAAAILGCILLNDYFVKRGKQSRCWLTVPFLCPNIAGVFGLHFLGSGNKAGRLISYYLPHLRMVRRLCASFILGDCQYRRAYQESRLQCCSLLGLKHWQHCGPVLLYDERGTVVFSRNLEHGCQPLAGGAGDPGVLAIPRGRK